MISKEKILKLYVEEGRSAKEAGSLLGVSTSTFSYWMRNHSVPKRTISEAIYRQNNPQGDPFSFKRPTTLNEAILFGLGVGLYWGEGTKSNLMSVRLGNTDPELIKTFIRFLERCFAIDKRRLHFGIQIFNDISKEEALAFWMKTLSVGREKFYNPTLSPSVSQGTYKKRSQYGVLTVYFNNKKLRNILVNLLPYKDF